MAANKYQPHVIVLPEDDANRQILNGFQLELPRENFRQFQVEPTAGGWNAVMDSFESSHISSMREYPDRRMVLVIDFDDDFESRLINARGRIPVDLQDRVFVLGARNEPEDLRAGAGSFEEIGRQLALDCKENTEILWGGELLKHNANELARLSALFREIFF
jgi:hypothetical protein